MNFTNVPELGSIRPNQNRPTIEEAVMQLIEWEVNEDGYEGESQWKSTSQI